MYYRVIIGQTPEGLSDRVSRLLNDGWELQGGVSVSHSEYMKMNRREGYDEVEESTIFAQAMIKRDTSP